MRADATYTATEIDEPEAPAEGVRDRVELRANSVRATARTSASVITIATSAAEVLTPEALAFVGRAPPPVRAAARRELLAARAERQARLDAGELPDFLPETQDVREGDWQVAPVPADLQDRRVEITGPVDRKMVINALNSGARCFMADFEDANSPTWRNCVEGQVNLTDAIERTIELDTGEKTYRLNDEVATLIVRPRGWHLDERNVPGGAGLRVALRLRALPVPQRAAAARARHRPVLLPAEAREPPRGAPLERRLRLHRGRRSASTAGRSRRPSSSRRSSPRSRWRRSSSSCATTSSA